MNKRNREIGFWYWMSILEPAYYFLAKSLGGEAEEQADAAMKVMAPTYVVLFILMFIGFVVWGVGRLFGLW